LAREVIYRSPWVNLYADRVRFSNGRVVERHHLLDFNCHASGAVIENDRGEVLLVRVYRYVGAATQWEIPAGRSDGNESPVATARREALEETGFTTRGHRRLYSYFPMNGIADHVFHIFWCRAGERRGDFDAGEINQIRWFRRAEIEKRLRRNSFRDGFSATALALWLLRGEGSAARARRKETR
jgi:ADP-ribose pyrophosphatase